MYIDLAPEIVRIKQNNEKPDNWIQFRDLPTLISVADSNTDSKAEEASFLKQRVSRYARRKVVLQRKSSPDDTSVPGLQRTLERA
jgi:hypothetical protein